jgi:hypothetical protein
VQVPVAGDEEEAVGGGNRGCYSKFRNSLFFGVAVKKAVKKVS